jgi:hypothetical protein
MNLLHQLFSQNRVKATIGDTRHLWKSGAGTRQLVPVFLKSKTRTRSRRIRAIECVNDFIEIRDSLDLTTDWFSHNIPRWLDVFRKAKISENDRFQILEIGSWEGQSACFLLNYFPNSTVHAVDTWAGGDEHDGLQSVPSAEKRFDENTASYSERVTKYKGTSDHFFQSVSQDSFYRIVYIDGSHRAEDVFNDASSGFSRLEVGGIMILDDLLWKFYEEDDHNPASGISRFLVNYDGSFKVIDVGHQLYLLKTR